MATVPATPQLTSSLPRSGLSRLGVSTHRGPDGLVLRLSGALDTYTAPRARERFARLAATADALAVDLTGVRVIDSAGLGALRGLANAAERAGTPLRLIAGERMRSLLTIGGVAPAAEVAEAA